MDFKHNSNQKHNFFKGFYDEVQQTKRQTPVSSPNNQHRTFFKQMSQPNPTGNTVTHQNNWVMTSSYSLQYAKPCPPTKCHPKCKNQ